MSDFVPHASLLVLTLIFLAGAMAGSLGALLGIGGGVFLVPFLTLALGIDSRYAIPISLTTVIATSTAVSAGTAGRQLINLRLGMVLEVATAAGGLLGGLTFDLIPERTLFLMFGVVTAFSGVMMLGRLNKRNVILDPTVDPGRLGGRYHEEESGGTVVYRLRRFPVAVLASFVAGNVSSILGIGGGIIKVPVLNAWCGVPLRAAAATSAFMIGVTATAGVVIHYGAGRLVPGLAAAAVLGVRAGSAAGFHFGGRARAQWLKLLLAVVLFVVTVLMFVKGLR
jgi:uncharacterized membrane protein YfcA